jgi:epoxyqueuosine reductase QueG
MLNEELETLLISNGASLVGFANLREIAPEVRDNFPSGISIAVALNPQVMVDIREGPTKRYYEEYRRANELLDALGQRAVEFLEGRGDKAKWFAATNAGIDDQTLSTRLPHKTVATRAGLGWIGKCALLITKRFGSAIRLTTVLTDAPIVTGQAVNISLCGHCTYCVDICPGHAPTGRDWQAGLPRESLVDAYACRETAREFELKTEGIHDNICGLCIVACPWTKKYLARAV